MAQTHRWKEQKTKSRFQSRDRLFKHLFKTKQESGLESIHKDFLCEDGQMDDPDNFGFSRYDRNKIRTLKDDV